MKEQLIQEIQRKMLPYLNNEQLLQLGDALTEALQGVSVSYEDTTPKKEERDAVEAFITAKRIEGCSEKTLKYYRKTIESMLSTIAKKASQITTDDLRKYLTTYQTQRRSSKVTIDNIRRILSSFFSWLEDEDFILKSPVRRIHKVKTAKLVKDTYTDEALELMRDSCTTTRDLAIIDLLASSGMRVGEMVMLNREDIDFNERECVVIGKGNKERLVLRCKNQNTFAELPQRAHRCEPGTVRLAESPARPADDRGRGDAASRAGKTLEFAQSTPTQIPANAGNLSHR